MPKDYKASAAPRAEGRLAHPMLLGIIIGLLLGIVISLAVALWLNRLSNPFVDKAKHVDPVAKFTPAQPAPPPEAAKAGERAAKGKDAPAEKPAAGAPAKGPERPRFEFYRILPGDREVQPPEKPAAAPARPAPPAPVASARPGSSPTTPKPHSGEVYWIQAGAFSEEREADNLKARIALTGLEASVRPVSIPERGTLYRVRLGPYQSLDDANRIKITLSQNGVGAAIIRTTDESR